MDARLMHELFKYIVYKNEDLDDIEIIKIAILADTQLLLKIINFVEVFINHIIDVRSREKHGLDMSSRSRYIRDFIAKLVINMYKFGDKHKIIQLRLAATYFETVLKVQL